MAYTRRRASRTTTRRSSAPARRRAPARAPARRAARPAARRSTSRRAPPREIRIVIQQPQQELPAAPVGENLTVQKATKKARL